MDCSNQVVMGEECVTVGGLCLVIFMTIGPRRSVVGTIGKGIFGSVLLLLVEGRNTGSIFVMKGISKEYMLKKKEQVKHTVQCMRGE